MTAILIIATTAFILGLAYAFWWALRIRAAGRKD